MDFCASNPTHRSEFFELAHSLEQVFTDVPQAITEFHFYSVAQVRQSVLNVVHMEHVELSCLMLRGCPRRRRSYSPALHFASRFHRFVFLPSRPDASRFFLAFDLIFSPNNLYEIHTIPTETAPTFSPSSKILP